MSFAPSRVNLRRWLCLLIPLGISIVVGSFYFLPLGFSTAQLKFRTYGSFGNTAYAIVETSQRVEGLRGGTDTKPLLYLLLVRLSDDQNSDVKVIGPLMAMARQSERGSFVALVPNAISVNERGHTTVMVDDTGQLLLLSPNGERLEASALKIEGEAAARWVTAAYESNRANLPRPYAWPVMSTSRRFALQLESAPSQDDDMPEERLDRGPKVRPKDEKVKLYDLRTGRSKSDPWLEKTYEKYCSKYYLPNAVEGLTDDLEYFVLMPQGLGSFAFEGGEYSKREFCLAVKRGSAKPALVGNAPNPLYHCISVQGELFFAGVENGNVVLVRGDGKVRHRGPKIPAWCANAVFGGARLESSTDRIICCAGNGVDDCFRVFWWNYRTGDWKSLTFDPKDLWVRRWNRFHPRNRIPVEGVD